MTKEKQKQNNNSNNTDTETEFMNSNNSKTRRPQTGVWKCFNRGQSKGDGHWKGTCKSKESCEALITQLQVYKEQKNTYEVKPNHLQCLAIKLFSVTPSSAICKRMFSALEWIYEKHQTCLDIDQLEGLAKIYRFNLSNPINQLCHSQTTEITSEIMMNIAETVFKKFDEILMDDDDAEMLNPTEDLYSNEQDLDLSISTFIDFNSS
ncbi:1194_t:CDS:2, partial [Cetraspora pellucida]